MTKKMAIGISQPAGKLEVRVSNRLYWGASPRATWHRDALACATMQPTRGERHTHATS